MNILKDIYDKKLAENEGKIRFWEDYLKNLKTLDFTIFSNNLTVPILVPIGSRIFFRGALKHTNEFTVSLGTDYFAKCSSQQAEILRQHRIQDAETKLDSFKKEKEYLESQINFSRENIFGNIGQDIMEVHTEEEDKAWREKHKENVKKYIQRNDKKEEMHRNEISDEALWIRLEELELQEELENELLHIDHAESKGDDIERQNYNNVHIEEDPNIREYSFNKDFVKQEIKSEFSKLGTEHNQNLQLDLLQKVLNKQNELEKKLLDLKNSDRTFSKTEGDLLTRLDEIEQLEELEDEMDRLNEIIHEDSDKDDSEEIESNNEIKKSVSFADEDESETLELSFKHSDIEPSMEPYNPEKGKAGPSPLRYKVTGEHAPLRTFCLLVRVMPAPLSRQAGTALPPRFRALKNTLGYSQSVNFRTTEANPTQHNDDQVGLFYTLDKNVCTKLYGHGGLPKNYMKQTKTFTETTLMVRQPALDIIDCIKSSDLNKPAIRYVLYGEKGTGKSLTIAHLLHYAHDAGFLIVHVPWVYEWLWRVPRHKEMSNSSTREGFVDLPLDAAAWLLHFKTQNQTLLKSSDLAISKEYVWSKREKTPAGAPLGDLIEHGISRVKFACDVIDALVYEVKVLSNNKKCKTFVAIDGYNCFFYPKTKLNTPTKKKVLPEEVTLTASFLDLTKNNWTNGAIVLSVDTIVVPAEFPGNYFPRQLLKKKGFEHLDPFVPVEVKRYSEKEYLSCASYYRDRLWLRGPEELEAELQLASAGNPYKFMELCAPL
ncbi:unnamed protein product, partial [Iphiclides podalirius]